ncbi:unnamed protein product [Urochloa decumbens]|uniref:DUF7595 domain-containing protein n=1 Tax=Urochloa decumbens TaxID=240449 RepID=A0ABC9B4W1_9POAL
MDADLWASLPSDLLVEVLRRQAITAVVRCAGACRPWRRSIIGNASSLQPSPDYFKQYDKLLSSRDGFLLLGGGSESKASDLCLFGAGSGTCRSIPAATLGAFSTCQYTLVTDDGSNDDSAAMWVLAVRKEVDIKRGLIYQIFFFASGEWGAVKRSVRFEKGVARAEMLRLSSNDMVVCRGAIYWLVHLYGHRRPRRPPRLCVFAINVRTEQTWTMELPEKCKELAGAYMFNRLFLATSEDNRLSLLIHQVSDHHMWSSDKIEVWVLIGDSEWTLQRAINMRSLIPDCPKEGRTRFIIRGFCQRSGCLFVDFDHKDLLIDINTGSLRPTGRVGIDRVSKYPYEIDWSTYLSKMKYF